MTTAAEVGKWLFDAINENAPKVSYQSVLVRRIREEFGEEFSYRNQNGNWAIDKKVLREFNKHRDEHIVWDRSDQTWRVLNEEQLAAAKELEAKREAYRLEQAERRRKWEEERASREA